MITIANKGRDETFVKYRGKSTDTKPTDCPNGSEFLEIDTGKTYFFDGAGETWIDPTA
jgi:hypothetical protein